MQNLFKSVAVTTLLMFTVTGCQSTGDGDFIDTMSNAASTVGGAVSSVTDTLLSPYEQGVFVAEQTLAKIKPGQSTKQDVIALVGQPVSKETLGNTEIWNYPYTKIPHFGKNISEKTTVEFDQKGIVINAYKSGDKAALPFSS